MHAQALYSSTCYYDTLSSCLLLRLRGAVLLKHCSTIIPSFRLRGPWEFTPSMWIRLCSELHLRLACLQCCHGLSVYCQCPHCLWWVQQAEQEFRAKVEAALEANEVDEDQLIEERRKRRQEILAKHRQGQGQGQEPQPGAHLRHYSGNHHLVIASFLLQPFLSTFKLLCS